jgi:serine protease Do
MNVRGNRFLVYTIVALVFVLAGMTLGLHLTVRALRQRPVFPSAYAEPAPSSVEGVPASVVGDLDVSRRTAIVRAAEQVGPATVSISVVRTQVVRRTPFTGSPFEDEFFERFFRGYFPDRRFERRYESYGSGVVIDQDGYILTNDHVVRGGSEVKVMLKNGREFDGRVLGGDSRFDLAVIKIEGEELPVAPLGDSDDLMIGEWAVAIGNPFGHLLNDTQPTVTAGVISAFHRDIQSEGQGGGVYKDMIQTDAAINPGNSGGPLVNSRGEVVGINTFIFTASGGSQGIGFAIPINVAKLIIDELIEFGRIRDVWVGVQVQEITKALAQSLGLSATQGVLASYVEPESPADRAGIRPGDIIVGVSGEAVNNIRQARRAIFGARVGDVITLAVIREGERTDFDVKLEEVPR